MDEVAVKKHLAETDDQFRELLEEHQQYERELEGFSGKPYLNPEEQVRETEIKKRKLFVKDRMQLFISHFQSQNSLS